MNYGRQEDYEELFDLMGEDFLLNMTCMARYGEIFRGNKVTNAANAGCAAAIIFSDPEDVAPEGTDEEDVYPNSLYLPGDGIQRGSAMIDNGDPQTPVWPSIPHVYRTSGLELGKRLPPIPAQPIGYDDAKRILEL